MEARVGLVQLIDPALLHAQGQKKSLVERANSTPRNEHLGVGWCWGITTVLGVQARGINGMDEGGY